MPLSQTSLRFARDFSSVAVRELTGFDEQSISGTETAAAIGLLDQVVEAPPAAEWRAAKLTASDRDRLLAAVYRWTYGARVETTAHCGPCGAPFDLSFSLDDLMDSVYASADVGDAERMDDGGWRLPNGAAFRLPTGEDELSVAALDAAAAAEILFERCVTKIPLDAAARAEMEDRIEALAPVVDLDIQTACPECGVRQALHFDLQSYLLGSLAQEREQLRREVHRIAGVYHWNLREILALPRSERRAFVGMIESDALARRRTQ
jgi:hypothetical protein